MKKENTTGGKIRIEVYILAVLLLIGAAVAVFFVVKLNNDRKQEDISIQRGNESVDQDIDGIDAASVDLFYTYGTKVVAEDLEPTTLEEPERLMGLTIIMNEVQNG